MSYDLFFYKHKSNAITLGKIGNYLSNNLTPVNQNGNQWFFENEETGVYYFFEKNEPEEDDDYEMGDEYKDFVNTGIAFNLNFIRPAFFGLEAFNFVEKFINDLDLYIDNPQSAEDEPGKPSKEFLFESWNKTNSWASAEHVGDKNLYCPIEKSNEAWEHNYQRQSLQNQVGQEYFVSKCFFFRERQTNKVVTLAMWPEHIPDVLPITDYYLLGRQYKKLFKTVKDKIILTKDEFNTAFGSYFEPFSAKNTIVIHPDKALTVAKTFNSVKPSLDIDKHLEGIPSDSIVNYK